MSNVSLSILETFHLLNQKAAFACVAEKCKFIRNSAEQTVRAEPLEDGLQVGQLKIQKTLLSTQFQKATLCEKTPLFLQLANRLVGMFPSFLAFEPRYLILI